MDRQKERKIDRKKDGEKEEKGSDKKRRKEKRTYVLVWYKTTLPLLSKNYRYYQIYGNAEYTKILNNIQK